MTKSRMPSVLLYINLWPPQALFTNLHCLNIARFDRNQIAMKNLFFSMLFLLPFLFCLANINGAAVPCSTVSSKAAACLGFATGKAPKPTPDCCTGLQDLAKTVKTVDDKKAIFANAWKLPEALWVWKTSSWARFLELATSKLDSLSTSVNCYA